MREISEYTLLGNYLIFLSERLGQESIKFELAKTFSSKVLETVNKNVQTYQLQTIENKMDIVRKMISKGVFRAENVSGTKTFKQIYNYEVSKNILAFYSPDGNLIFKFPKQNSNDSLIFNTKQYYSSNLGLDLKNAINSVLKEHELKNKSKLKNS